MKLRLPVSWIVVLGVAITACQSNCQQTTSKTKPACMPQSMGDPAPDPLGNCGMIGGATALRVCINHCKPIAALGQPCTNDLCADGGAVCDAKLACAPDGAGGTKCVTPPTTACDPTLSAQDNACSAGTFCKRIGQGACPGLDSNPPVTLCAAWVSEGGACDGDYSATAPLGGICSPCEPGTTCVKPTGSPTGICERACSAANPQASCPCEGFRCILSSASTPAGSYCQQCAADGVTCEAMGGGTVACCDSSAQCNGSTGNECCRTSGTACTSASQCCAGPHATAMCTSGTCTYQCATGWADCDHVAANGCEVNLSSAGNCGSCGHTCPAAPAGGTEVCSSGLCVAHCPAGETDCSNTCVNESTDVNNCGSCGHHCPAAPAGGTETCSSGVCNGQCSSGLTLCGNTCVNLHSDPNNCGSCGHSCGGQACNGSICAPTCEPFGALCGPGTVCCAPDSCKTIPATGDIRCCNQIDPITQTCTN